MIFVEILDLTAELHFMMRKKNAHPVAAISIMSGKWLSCPMKHINPSYVLRGSSCARKKKKTRQWRKTTSYHTSHNKLTKRGTISWCISIRCQLLTNTRKMRVSTQAISGRKILNSIGRLPCIMHKTSARAANNTLNPPTRSSDATRQSPKKTNELLLAHNQNTLHAKHPAHI